MFIIDLSQTTDLLLICFRTDLRFSARLSLKTLIISSKAHSFVQCLWVYSWHYGA